MGKRKDIITFNSEGSKLLAWILLKMFHCKMFDEYSSNIGLKVLEDGV
jgi:hypothetical protein